MRPRLCTFATAALIVFAAQAARGQCCGDCNGNGTVAINELITAVNNALGECATPPACGLPATGQRTSYGAGSDGHVQAGVALSATDNDDGTVTDNTTGLMWEKKDDAGGIHDQDNTYTWGKMDSPYTMNGTMVTEFLPALNTPPCFAGHCDWRIPNLRELQSVLDYEPAVGPAARAAFNQDCAPGCTIDGIGGPRCSCTQSSGAHWSSTTLRANPSLAWNVSFNVGLVNAESKVFAYYIRAVRGGS